MFQFTEQLGKLKRLKNTHHAAQQELLFYALNAGNRKDKLYVSEFFAAFPLTKETLARKDRSDRFGALLLHDLISYEYFDQIPADILTPQMLGWRTGDTKDSALHLLAAFGQLHLLPDSLPLHAGMMEWVNKAGVKVESVIRKNSQSRKYFDEVLRGRMKVGKGMKKLPALVTSYL